MKKILTKISDWFDKHPVCRHVVLMLLDSLLLIWTAIDMAIRRPFAEHPSVFIVDMLMVVLWSGLLCNHLSKIIGIHVGAWNCMNITNSQIIQLIIGLAKEQDDINSGKIAWKAAFYDPSTHVVEVTRVPIEEYLADTTKEPNAVVADPNPTVDEKSPE